MNPVERIASVVSRIGRVVGNTSQETLPPDVGLLSTMLEDIADVITESPSGTVNIQEPKAWYFQCFTKEKELLPIRQDIFLDIHPFEWMQRNTSGYETIEPVWFCEISGDVYEKYKDIAKERPLVKNLKPAPPAETYWIRKSQEGVLVGISADLENLDAIHLYPAKVNDEIFQVVRTTKKP